MSFSTLPMRVRRWTIATIAGASAYQMAGCSQEVSDILTNGFADASVTLFTALITALFTGMNQPNSGVSVTAQAIIDNLPFLA